MYLVEDSIKVDLTEIFDDELKWSDVRIGYSKKNKIYSTMNIPRVLNFRTPRHLSEEILYGSL